MGPGPDETTRRWERMGRRCTTTTKDGTCDGTWDEAHDSSGTEAPGTELETFERARSRPSSHRRTSVVGKGRPDPAAPSVNTIPKHDRRTEDECT
mmetsp:Transcript_2111/g.13741  ORF Transcript_2111/g.13741 Transcript_2111/m.13741 type:complete len:95 (-) Transcript_2111:2141-2425(-)